jgi:hypothetical protein
MIVYQLPVSAKEKYKIKIKQHYVGDVRNINIAILRKLRSYCFTI